MTPDSSIAVFVIVICADTAEPFSDAVIAQLYPTREAYVAAARARTEANLRAGYIVEADARESRARAEQSVFGYGYPCAAACKAG